MKYHLLLASGSASRKKLLESSGISFSLVSQDADESTVDATQGLQQVVQELAQLKMQHVHMPQGAEGDVLFILTADTLNEAVTGELLGKPVDKQDAIRMLKLSRLGLTIGTGFCITKQQYKNGAWHVVAKEVGYGKAFCIFDVPDFFVEDYLASVSYLTVSGAATVEDKGVMFLRQVQGDYYAIIGLPMYEVTKTLFEMGFFA